MKFIYILVVLVILAVLGFLFFSPSETSAPSDENVAGSGEMMNEGEHMEDEGGSMMEGEGNVDVEGGAMMDGGIGDVSGEVQEFNLTGKNFEFSQKEMRVKQGDTVRVVFTSTDGFHDWMVDGFNVATDKVQEGETATVEFVADEKGSFEYYCSVGNHRQLGMVGTLVVE